MRLRIARASEGKITHYDVFEFELKTGMTVLDALFYIQDNIDPTLSFRYSCRGAVCGSCGMLVNKMPILACRTQLKTINETQSKLKKFDALKINRKIRWDKKNEILIEPLPNFPIIKDLVVNMDKFYAAVEDMKLWATTVEGNEARSQTPEQRKVIERYVNCIMCALCFGSCPVNAEHEEYLGPAALAKSYRFYKDSRVEDSKKYLKVASGADGAVLCDLIMNCVKACPKGVAPGGAIRMIKKEIEK